jgi:hypothetical protein
MYDATGYLEGGGISAAVPPAGDVPPVWPPAEDIGRKRRQPPNQLRHRTLYVFRGGKQYLRVISTAPPGFRLESIQSDYLCAANGRVMGGAPEGMEFTLQRDKKAGRPEWGSKSRAEAAAPAPTKEPAAPETTTATNIEANEEESE